ncbi:MAG: GTPase Era, partial [Bacteroidales bacterium]|nr:GTPase Era [Bacteroidales bacterium]
TDVFEDMKANERFLEKVKKANLRTFLVINKIDQTKEDTLEELFDRWKEELPNATIFPISALHKFNVDNLLSSIKAELPEAEPFFDKDQLTDKPSRFFVTEIIREKILQYYSKEIPYAVEPVVEEFKDEPNIIKIMAQINVERESQKGIIIGHQGKALKKVGTEARKELEAFFGKKVFIQIFVKVQKDWRSKDFNLKQFGYES